MTTEENYTHKTFMCTITFDEPRGGPTYVAAKDAEEAKDILVKTYGHTKNFTIIKVVATDEIKPSPSEAVETTTEDQVEPAKKVMN